jgi:hypothetical protein
LLRGKEKVKEVADINREKELKKKKETYIALIVHKKKEK